MRLAFLWFGLLLILNTARADIVLPNALQDWADWVMRDQPEHSCPIAGGAEQRLCIWYSSLQVISATEGASFELLVRSFAKGNVKLQLPGDEEYWPKEVQLDGRATGVIEQDARPYVILTEGEHRITGRFNWSKAPQTLTVPEQLALVSLTHEGKAVINPLLQQGRLTLSEGVDQDLAPAQNSLSVRAYRKLEEAVPMRLVTRLVLDVSGRPREIRLGLLAPDNTVLERLNSVLPVRVDNDGYLIAQVKSGSWQIEAESRYVQNVDSTGPIKQMEAFEFWPQQEIWVYQPDVSIRSVSFTDLDSIDTEQTDLPPEWKHLTAWRLGQGETLSWTTQSRGNQAAATNQLNLKREAWLDFSADGWTVRDNIDGRMSTGWRLLMSQPYQLGSVTQQERPLVVVDYEEGRGIELRDTPVGLQAMSRIAADQFNTHLGWNQDFESAQIKLNLPPGWSVFMASGPSSAQPTWIGSWNLWNVFWVLLLSVATTRLLGLGWGLLAAGVLVLNYHEYDSPEWIWMALLVTAALLKVVSHPGWRKGIITVQAISALVFAFIAVPYAIQQVRQAIYPQLEFAVSSGMEDFSLQDFSAMQETAVAPSAPESLATDAAQDQVMSKELSRQRSYAMVPTPAPAKKAVLEQPDQSAQTGPAQPQWNWHSVNLNWSGPVQAGEDIDVWLVSPSLERLLSVVRVLGVFLLAFGLLKAANSSFRGSAGALVLVLAVAITQPNSAEANVPPQEMLDQLKAELSKAPSCLPGCVGNSETSISLQQNMLEIRQKLQSATSLALVLPQFTDAQVQAVRLDGKPAVLLNDNGTMRVWVPEGGHELVIQARLLGASVEVTFDQAPHNVQVNATQWTYEGLVENRLPSNSVRFEYVEKTRDEPLARFPATLIAGFARVERVVSLGQEWSVSTRVYRVAPDAGAISLRVPLLPGERVLTDGVTITEKEAVVSLRPEMAEYGWESKLELAPELALTASDGTSFYERWKFLPSTYWHVEFEGIAAKAEAQSQHWQPEFLPFPGEKIKLSIQALKPADGVSLTFDSAKLNFTPGDRMTRSELITSFRSTKGGEHQILLPEGSEIETLLLDGQPLPSVDQQTHPTFSFSPGKHTLAVHWKNDTAMGFWSTSPVVSFQQYVSNISVNWQVPADRWILFVSGGTLGPAVLFWGVFLLVVVFSVLLGRSGLTPVSTLSWLLLGAGLCTVSLWVGVFIILWFVLLQWRGQKGEALPELPFNLMQLLIVLLTLAMVVGLVFSVPQSLLGSPDMGITGNGSSAYDLRWYQDASPGNLTSYWVISVPLWVYRLSMLAWALWLAFKFVDWLRWGWTQFNQGSVWKRPPDKPKTEKAVK